MTSQVAHDAVAHYLSKGISKAAACGLVAVLVSESNLNPGSQGVQSTETPGALNPSGAYGIASWNGARQQALKDFGTRKGLDPSVLTTQLDFVLTEAANSYPKVWAAIGNPTTTYSDMVTLMVDEYENPADHQGEINRALPVAAALFAEPIDPATAPVPTPAPPPAPPAPVPTPPPAPAPIPAPAYAANQQAIVAMLSAAQGLIDQALTLIKA